MAVLDFYKISALVWNPIDAQLYPNWTILQNPRLCLILILQYMCVAPMLDKREERIVIKAKKTEYRELNYFKHLVKVRVNCGYGL